MGTRKIAVVGLGYVGLPLAVALAQKYPVIGFDISAERVASLKRGEDATREISADQLKKATGLSITDDSSAMKDCNIFIVTVPTPIDEANRPEFTALLTACALVGPNLKKGDIVVFESTVYPGVTEEICGPELERWSGLRAGPDFKLGYSPERINPGDKERPIHKIMKVVAGSDAETLDGLADLYGSIIEAGVHRASSIKVAEAAKVIENTQRDVNIALINELALIFARLGIDTEEVLQAAGSKWNFLPFRPGLVGGHCIGVDPYYLTHKAQEIGYHPEMILAGRRINDAMPVYVAGEIVKLMTRRRIQVNGARALVLGVTFKENCPDIRNSKVVELIRELQNYGVDLDVHDPWADATECKHEYGLRLTRTPKRNQYDVAIVAVAHREFRDRGAKYFRRLCRRNHVLYDIKHAFAASDVDGRL